MNKEKQISGLKKHSRESNEFVKECLKSAMIQLAKEMDYHDISVTKLCQKAGVSRMGFYRNYSITNDVIYEIAYELNDYVITTAGSPFRETTTKEWYEKVFHIIADNKDAMSLMFHESFQHEWMKIVNSFAIHDPRFSPEKKYQRIMWSGGFESSVNYWLNNGMKESPEEMAEYCFQYLPHLLNEK